MTGTTRFLLIPVLAVLHALPARGAESGVRAVIQEKHRQLLEEHCQSCHGAEKQKGKFRVDDLSYGIHDVQTAARWQKVLDAMNAGEMPPEDEKQPDAKAKTDFLEDLANTMVAARRTLADQHGEIALRRLNQREYQNTLRALLGVEIDVSELPSDVSAAAFDTVGSGLFMSGNQFEQYEAIGRVALEQAALEQLARSAEKKHRFEVEETLEKIRAFHQENLDAVDRGQRWVKAVNAAVALPENAKTVADLRKTGLNSRALLRNWEKVPGAPAPEEFGFKTKSNNADQAFFWSGNVGFLKFDSYYLSQPHLDTGAYLTIDRQHHVNSWLYLRIPTDFPPGDYVLRVRIAATSEAPPERRFLEFGVQKHAGALGQILSTHAVGGTMDKPEILEIPFRNTRQRRGDTLFIREKGTRDHNSQAKAKFDAAKTRNGIGPEVALWVDWMELELKPQPAEPLPSGLRALGLGLDDKAPAPTPDVLRGAVERFAIEAFRGLPPSAAYLDRLLALYGESRRAGSTHGVALKEILAAVLASPKFLYRAEPAPADNRRTLTGNELATRLSYFLWGAPPDPALRALGKSGDLLRAEVLAAQTHRLLEDPQARGFVEPFTRQWLGLDRLDFFEFNRQRFPRFDISTKNAARREVSETFAHLLRENASLTHLLKADYAIVNGLLANYYGIPGVRGDAWRKVALPKDSPRGGLLGMAAVLAMGSNGEHTSPVERGAWVLRKVLNDPPPPAPANVPAITRLAGKVLTTRERVLAHQEDPQCASCHRKIDPIGFGLENFDAVGQWRTEDSYEAKDNDGKPLPKAKKTWAIDPAGAFHKGAAFANYQELRGVVASKHESFARGFTSALIEYALGRPCGFSDETLVDGIVEQARARGFAVRAFVHALIQSKEFHSK
jgi:hypothetical protein